MLQVLYSDYSRINILINEDEEIIITTDDMEVLDRFSMTNYQALNSNKFIQRFNALLKKYFQIDKKVNGDINKTLYKQAFDRFLKSDFVKELKGCC